MRNPSSLSAHEIGIQQPQIQQLDLEAECLAEQDQGDDDHHAHA